MKNYPNSAIHSYYIVKIFEYCCFSGEFGSDDLCHDTTLAYYFAWVKFFALFSKCPIIYDPYISTLPYSNLTKLRLIHVFSMMKACCELIEKLDDRCLTRAKIFTSQSVIIVTSLISFFELTSVKLMWNIACPTERFCICLGYSIKRFWFCERFKTSLYSSLIVFFR